MWKDALAAKAQAPYMRHSLAGGTLRDFHFCPFEVGLLRPHWHNAWMREALQPVPVRVQHVLGEMGTSSTTGEWQSRGM